MREDAAGTLDRLAEEYVQRLRAGEPATQAAYEAAHPGLAGRIRELFPLLALMEGLKQAPEPPAGTEARGATAADVPERIGPYAVVRELGRGGMGRVYEVSDAAGRRLALKVVQPHLLQRPGFLERFLREIETGLRIEHPGVVQTLASGVAEVEGAEVPYVLLEYVEGDTLRSLLEEAGAVSERLAREIGAAIADALAAIHAAGIVHRDIKPENVILAPDESIKLMDLGVALVHEEALRLTQTGEFVGSLLYAAPEQLRRQQVDARCDLYALGLVLFELSSGRHAEAGGAGPVLPQKLDVRGAPCLRDVAPGATPFFERVVERLLAPDPNDRFDSAEEVARILAEGEEGAWWTATRGAGTSPGRPRRFEGAVTMAGRDGEHAQLDAAWAEVRRGRGQVRLLRGDAGIGKSRLVSSWLDRIEGREPSVRTVWIEHAPGVHAVGLAPIGSALRDVLADDGLARVRAWLGDRADRAEEVLASLDVDAGAQETGSLDNTARETMYIQLLRGAASERAIVLVVEDLHFATDEGRALFARLAHALAGDAVLLLGTTRPVEPEPLAAVMAHLAHADTVEVAPLDEAAALDVLRAGLGPAPQSLDAVRALVRMSDGNPYCLLEFAHDLRSRASADRALGGDFVLPRSIREMVEVRLRSLSADDRDLLAMAACCGHRFDPVVVCEAAGLPRLGGLRTLHRLERERGLIVADGTEYRFHHHLVQEALHDELPPALRATCHAALGAACEARLPATRPATGAEAFAVARHFLHGDEPARAEPHVLDGLDYLISLSEGRRAARMARAALEALPDAAPDLRARLLFHRGRALDGHAPPTEIVAVLEEALAAAKPTPDRALEVDVLQHLGAAISHAGRHADAADISRRAVELAERIEDPIRHARALTSHAGSLYNMGDHDAAFAAGRRALDLAQGHGAAVQAAQTATVLSGIYLEAGRLDDARLMAEFALSATHVHGDRAAEQFVSTILAKMTHMQGDVGGALTLLERGQRLAREMGNLRVATAADIGLAHAQLNRGLVAEAIERADQALAVCASMGYPEIAALISIPRAIAASTRGDLGDAWASASAGRELLAKVPLPAIAARVCPGLGQLLAWMGRFEEAAAVLERGLTAADEAGVPRERALLRQAEASLLDARGRTRPSAEAYADVLHDVRARGMGLHVAFVAQRLGGLHVRLGESDEARGCLQEALAIARGGPLPSVVATCAIWLDLLPTGSLPRARIALERDGAVLPARARLRLLLELASRTGDPGDRAAARALAEELLASVPEVRRARMRTEVALYRDALA